MKGATKPNRSSSQVRVNAPCYSFKIAGDKGINLYNCDWRDLLSTYEDNHFELAIVDPPYAVGAADGRFGGKKEKPSNVSVANGKKYANHDKTPDKSYFNELFRVSKNQIIWGSNYYPNFLKHSGAIVWDKLTTGPLSDCEIAYQSFNKLVAKYTHKWSGVCKGRETGIKRVHPNQKPIALYRWLLQNYAKEGDKILDTHLGSGSIAIACYEEKFDLTACEIDEEYFEAMKNRVEEYRKQLKLF